MLPLALFLLAFAPSLPATTAAAMASAALGPVNQASSSSCPYDLATAAQMIPRECHANATAAAQGGATGCCWYVFAAYIFAAADHANRTGEAFMPPGPTAACSDAFAALLLTGGLVQRSLLAGNGSCDLTGGGGDPGAQLAAGARPCQLATIGAVRALAPAALPNATRLCAAPGMKPKRAPLVRPDTPGCSACRDAVIATTYEMLASARTKEFVPCGMAATVAVWSRAPPPLKRYTDYALCMLQVLENVNSLGTGDLVPAPPPPPAAAASATESPPPASSSSSSSSKSTVAPIAAGSAAAGVAAVVCLCLAAVAIRRRRRKRTAAGDSESGNDSSDDDDSVASLPVLPREGLYIFTKAELMQATNGYDKKLLLGTGGAGKVYLGHLPSGQRVAIKKIYRSKKVSEFYAEVAVLAKLRHRNLTTLVGYCLGGGRGGGDHALVYEYMAGGNLWRALFQGGEQALTWRRRLEVAVDVAEGLAYLHGLGDGAVVHRDVKPTNILLSESGAAKLSDFGVSRIVPEGGTHVSTEVRGTRGYVDPESFTAGTVSEAADVYSFGVVLLELATGMRAVVPTPSGGAESIVQAAHWAVSEAGGASGTATATAAEAMVDRRLGPAWDRVTVCAVFALACRCVRPYKHERPEIAEVLAVLKAVLADYNARVDGDVLLTEAENSEGTDDTASSSAATPEMAGSMPSTSSSSTLNTEVMSPASLHEGMGRRVYQNLGQTV